METLKDTIISLCRKNNVKYDRIKYYKQSPYQKRRYKSEYVGEEVWLKVNGFNYVFNGIDNIDENGNIEPYFNSLFC